MSLIKRICIYLPLFTFKERNSGLFCQIFLKFTFDNFTSPVGLAILKFNLPGQNFTSLGHRACTIFRRLVQRLTLDSATFNPETENQSSHHPQLNVKFESDWTKTAVCIVPTSFYTKSAKIDLDL